MGGRGSKSTRAGGGGRAEAQENAAADNVPTREAGERKPGTSTQTKKPAASQARSSAAQEAQNQANQAERSASNVRDTAAYYRANPDVRPRAMTVAGAGLDSSRAFTHAKNARTQANKAGTPEARAAATKAEAAAQRADADRDFISNAFRTRQGPL